MTYAAEPYAQFVDDLLAALTGGETRETFRFVPEAEPFKLARAAVLPSSLRLFGLVDVAYRRFRLDTDYELTGDGVIRWRRNPDGTPARDAVLPDDGSVFYASYEVEGAVRLLTDRNPGSVTRLLAESFSREFAVLSRQMEAIYQAGFLDTATGRDLDQLAVLVGARRRRRLSATGSVLFARSTPAPADVNIPAGTRLSTVEPPPVSFETSEDRVLQRGNLSVEVPVAALASGSRGIMPAGAIRVVNRPILGIETVENPQATRYAGADETDEELRARARRALEGAGRATNGALLSALGQLPGLREKDVRIAEDYLTHPGVVRLTVALPEMAPADRDAAALQAVQLIEAVRPVGVRFEHNIDAAVAAGQAAPGPGTVADGSGDPVVAGVAAPGALFMPVDVTVEVTPTTLALTPDARARLESQARATVEAFIADAGLGEALIYNRLVAMLMALNGVLDVGVEIFPSADPGAARRKNLIPANPAVRPSRGEIIVRLGGSLIMLDVLIAVTLRGPGLLGDPATNKEAARAAAEIQLRSGVGTTAVGATLTPALLEALLPGTDSYTIAVRSYVAAYSDAGVRFNQHNVRLPLTGLERLWVRSVKIEKASA
jgi:uncharacterized phage protein gp47/JayE